MATKGRGELTEVLVGIRRKRSSGYIWRRIAVPAVLCFLALTIQLRTGTSIPSGAPVESIGIDYPPDGAIFPPEIAPPRFVWYDPSSAVSWTVEVTFADGTPGRKSESSGDKLQIGPIDPACIAQTNEPPQLSSRESLSRTWSPSAELWRSIKQHSTTAAAKVTVHGFLDPGRKMPVSRGQVSLMTSSDAVGAPIFYRDVPLMPTETEKGDIKPLAPYAVRLIRWRLKDISENGSRILLENLPMCANCHSFSADGKTLGMDLDGLQGNRGLYALAPVRPETEIRDEDVIQWSTARGRLKGNLRIGFMSQVSPDGRYVVTTINDVDAMGLPGEKSNPPSNYYVANFKDYRFLQVFFATRGILAWYSRNTGILQPLPGAADPGFVQTGAVWSPDGQYLVFARARAIDPNPTGAPEAKAANDPNERQIQYDLFRIPFLGGKGGMPEPIAGASHNGFSNSFPKISPDGRWIVFVKCRNGLLMRPDSELYIVPSTGGAARRMRCNLKPMNSWHSFSPNGRWLVFSSKAGSPYTRMYLTHIDQEGNDSPAILIENVTEANRAVNIPEFVNIGTGGFERIAGPVIEFYRLADEAAYYRRVGQYERAVDLWKQALAVRPADDYAHQSLGTLLLALGRATEAAEHLNRKAPEGRKK